MMLDAPDALSSPVEIGGLAELPQSLTPRAAGSMVDFLPVSEVGR
jgi:hypothetical protein